jgi:hypothetical protein
MGAEMTGVENPAPIGIASESMPFRPVKLARRKSILLHIHNPVSTVSFCDAMSAFLPSVEGPEGLFGEEVLIMYI